MKKNLYLIMALVALALLAAGCNKETNTDNVTSDLPGSYEPAFKSGVQNAAARLIIEMQEAIAAVLPDNAAKKVACTEANSTLAKDACKTVADAYQENWYFDDTEIELSWIEAGNAANKKAVATYSFIKKEQSQQSDPINEETLAGTWEGGVVDVAQSYIQKWRLRFKGNQYTAWHMHQEGIFEDGQYVGTIDVGNKETGTWEYADGVITLTPSRQFASYFISNMSPLEYTYYDYDVETMEAGEWYETPEAVLQDGIERDLAEGTTWVISKWPISLSGESLSIKVNMDTFILERQPMPQASDLVGKWKLGKKGVNAGFAADGAYSIYDDEIQNWRDVGTWSLEEEILTIHKDGYDTEYSIEFCLDKKVLVLWGTDEYAVQSGAFLFLYKDGSVITGDANSIQGTWDWYFFGNPKTSRIRFVFSQNNFEMIIFPWGEKYAGTFTYENGYATLNVDHCYTSRYHGNSSEDTIQFNEETYEITATWMDTYEDWQGYTYPYEGALMYDVEDNILSAPFVVVRDGVAYGTMDNMGLNGVYHRR